MVFRLETVKYTMIGAVFLLAFSCGTNKKIDREAVKREIEAREIKRITDAELLAEGEKLGNWLADQARDTLLGALKAAIAKNNIKGAIAYCSLNASALVKGFEDSLNVEIRRVSQKARTPENTPDSLENMILEAYAYSFAADSNSTENVRPQILELNRQELLFTRPITIASSLCLNCHGTPSRELPKGHYELIRSLYPKDQAVNYRLHELRGMWSIRIPKKTVIDRL